ncbi:diguanylate cyclase [Aliikangiella maris]|uniref:diguanylate cyclase n=2 Tax=Aliikangiella maris TaxID=3162458 RepID=A0ABV3MUB8_9GAMM
MDRKPIVLLVDDMPANIKILADCLSDQYRIKVATDGYKCLSIANSNDKPDLILLDIEMPELNGHEVCRRLKQSVETANIPVIFVTAKSENRDEEKGFKIGAVDYITKPIHPAIVKARVATHIILKLQKDELSYMINRDQLTRLYNRQYFLKLAYKKLARSIQHERDLSIIIIDIDDFNQINEQYGLTVGDNVIKNVASILTQHCGKEDIAARYTGEEFIILVEECNLQMASDKAENIRQSVAAATPGGLDITVSVGVAQINLNSSSFEQALKKASKALKDSSHSLHD